MTREEFVTKYMEKLSITDKSPDDVCSDLLHKNKTWLAKLVLDSIKHVRQYDKIKCLELKSRFDMIERYVNEGDGDREEIIFNYISLNTMLDNLVKEGKIVNTVLIDSIKNELPIQLQAFDILTSA